MAITKASSRIALQNVAQTRCCSASTASRTLLSIFLEGSRTRSTTLKTQFYSQHAAARCSQLANARSLHPVRFSAGFSTSPTFGSSSASESPTSPSQSEEMAPPAHLDEAELNIFKKLSAALSPAQLSVRDVSGGCGSMYALDIVSTRFEGLSRIKQHRLVTEVLKDEVAGWHGVQIKTATP